MFQSNYRIAGIRLFNILLLMQQKVQFRKFIARTNDCNMWSESWVHRTRVHNSAVAVGRSSLLLRLVTVCTSSVLRLPISHHNDAALHQSLVSNQQSRCVVIKKKTQIWAFFDQSVQRLTLIILFLR